MPELTQAQVDKALEGATVQATIESMVASLKQEGSIPYFATRVGRPTIKRRGGEPGQLDITIRFNTGHEVILTAAAGDQDQ